MSPLVSAHNFIPGDQDKSRFRFILVAAERARQIARGAPPILPCGSKKPTMIAAQETRMGLIRYRTE